MIKRKYLIRNKNVQGWFNWYQMIYQYMRIKPITVVGIGKALGNNSEIS